MKRLIVDTPNLIYRIAAAQCAIKNVDPKDAAGLAMHTTLNTLLKYFRKIKPDQIATVFEGRDNWRKKYTKSDNCVSKRIYKANRAKSSFMEYVFGLVADFETLVREHTSLICLSHPNLEGDDLIAGFCQKYKDIKEDETFILSGDNDFKQLLRYNNVRILNPDKDKPIYPEEIDANYFIFEKCFRGDPGDNVMSAYPRLRSTKIRKAYEDDYTKTQIFNEEWSIKDDISGEELKMNVGKLWKENQLLMDLECQPDDIKQIIKETIDFEIQNHGKFSFFHFNKFLGKYELKKIAENSQIYVDMLSSTHLNSEYKNIQKDKNDLNEKTKEKLKSLRNLIVY
jgi:5'-3' exonuclease